MASKEISCPQCQKTVPKRRLAKHLRQTHGLSHAQISVLKQYINHHVRQATRVAGTSLTYVEYQQLVNQTVREVFPKR